MHLRTSLRDLAHLCVTSENSDVLGSGVDARVPELMYVQPSLHVEFAAIPPVRHEIHGPCLLGILPAPVLPRE
jgi:hypothetical protein